jgi:hypothetical protein
MTATISDATSPPAAATPAVANEDWPTRIEIVAYSGAVGRKGKRRSVEIPADQFFGYGAHGAPMSGDVLIAIIHQLRKQGPGKQTQ